MSNFTNSLQPSPPPVEKPKPKRWKRIAIVLALTIGILLVIGALFGEPESPEPFKVGLFIVTGDPSVDSHYTVYLGLHDERSSWIKPSGVARVRILDLRGNVLYEGEYSVKTSDYGRYTHALFGGEFIAVSLTVPIAEVRPGVTDITGLGRAEVEFVSKKGTIVRGKYDLVNIPRLPSVKIENVKVLVTPSDLLEDVWVIGYGSVFEGYGENNVTISIYNNNAYRSIRVLNITLQTKGLSIVKVDPALPYTIEPSGSISLKLTLASTEGYRGSITVTLFLEKV